MTSHNPPTTQQLDEIAARAAGLYEYATGLDQAWQDEADQLAGTDVPLLLAEVRRLNFRLAELGEQGPDDRETVAEAAQMYRSLRAVIERTMTDPDRWDGDEDESFHLGRYVEWLAAGQPDDDGQPSTEPFRFVDDDGDYLHIGIPHTPANGGPAVSFHTETEPVHVPVDRIEELITVLRRLVAAQSPSAAAGSV